MKFARILPCSKVSLTLIVVHITSLNLLAVSAEVPLRVWTDRSGKLSQPARYDRLISNNEVAVFKNINGKELKCPIGQLSRNDVEYIKVVESRIMGKDARLLIAVQSKSLTSGKKGIHLTTSTTISDAIEASVRTTVRSPSNYLRAPQSPREPLMVPTTRELQYTVRIPRWESVRCVERYGLFGRRCRIVIRRVQKFSSEERTQQVTSLQSVMSVFNFPDSVQVSDNVTLDTPLSAGAISELIAGQLDVQFSDEEIEFRAINDDLVDYRTVSADAAVQTQIAITILSDRRNLLIEIAALDEQNAANSKTEADAILKVVKEAILRK